MRTQLAEHEEVREREREARRGGEAYPGRGRTMSMPRPGLRDRGCVCAVWELEGARHGQATPILKCYKGLGEARRGDRQAGTEDQDRSRRANCR